LFVLPTERAVASAIAKGGPRAIEAVASLDDAGAIGEAARAIADAEPAERAITADDAVDRLRERVVARLLWLRVMAPAASGLGLAGAAVQASWAQSPPGILALDPDRVLGIAASAGATCLALGIAGSTTALGALFFLRRRAGEVLAATERVADVAHRAPADAWTTTSLG
jgi:hypothetical protein